MYSTTIKDLYFTLQGGDGFSVHANDGTRYEGIGFAVGGAAPNVLEVHVDVLSYNTFQREVKALVELAEGMEDYCVIGGWCDADGTAYVELSNVYGSRSKAMMMGYERGEIAIWDFEKGESIELGPQ